MINLKFTKDLVEIVKIQMSFFISLISTLVTRNVPSIACDDQFSKYN